MEVVGGGRLRPGGLAALWERAVSFDRARPQVGDLIGAAALGALSSASLMLRGHADAAAWYCDVGLLVPVVWRRSRPTMAFAALAGVAFIQWLVAGPLLADASLLVGLFSVVCERPRREGLGAWAVLEVGVVLASLRWGFTGSWVRSLVGLSGLAAVALLAGVVFRARRAHLAELTDRAARLEFERDQRAQIAAAAERTRIAREMHDVIAHSLAVMISMADGASAKLRRDPELAEAAIATIGNVGRQALGETRRLLGVLRDPGGAAVLAPQPGLDQVHELLSNLRATGLDAVLDVDGHCFAVPPSAELTIYRIVQEAVTNTLKHGIGATAVRVAICFQQPRLTVTVTDDGAGGGPGTIGGHGIAGMRERVALYRGTLEAGPVVPKGWVVRASLIVPPDAVVTPAPPRVTFK